MTTKSEKRGKKCVFHRFLLPGGVFDPVFHFWWSLKISMKLTDITILSHIV